MFSTDILQGYVPETCFCPPGRVSPFQVTCEGAEYILVRQLCNFRVVVWLIFTFLSQGRQRNRPLAKKFTSASRKTMHAAAFQSDWVQWIVMVRRQNAGLHVFWVASGLCCLVTLVWLTAENMPGIIMLHARRRNAFTSVPFGRKLSPFYQCWSVSPVLNVLYLQRHMLSLLHCPHLLLCCPCFPAVTFSTFPVLYVVSAACDEVSTSLISWSLDQPSCLLFAGKCSG